MGLFNNKNDEFSLDTTDTLVVFDHDSNSAEIVRVTTVDSEAIISAGRFKVPIADCEIATGVEGRVFFYRAPTESITETKNLARLEYNTVLNQITSYKPPVPPTSMDWTKGLLFGLLFVAIILVAF